MSANGIPTNGRRHYSKRRAVAPTRIAAYVAPKLGMEPGSVEQLIRGRAAVNIRCAAIIEGFIALGDQERLARFVAPLDAARAGVEAPPFCAATFQLAQDADGREESAETAYHTDPSDTNLDRYIRALEEQQQRGDALLRAAHAERTRRRGLA